MLTGAGVLAPDRGDRPLIDLDVTFGWSVAPQAGANALSLCQAADERRYERALMRAARPQYSIS